MPAIPSPSAAFRANEADASASTDLSRPFLAGATLILAALAAQGTSSISGVEHVDRGYERIESKLVALGAQITRSEA